jgi:hypothetical protein
MLGTSSKLELVLECEEMLLGAYRRADLVERESSKPDSPSMEVSSLTAEALWPVGVY